MLLCGVLEMASDGSLHEAPTITTLNNAKLDAGNGSPRKEFSPSKYYKQTYRKDWELMPDFKGWLSCVPGEPTRAYCKFCEKTLHAHRLSLLKHTCTLKHTRAAKNDHNNKQSADPMGARKVTPQTDSAAPVDEDEDNSEPAKPVSAGLKEEVITCTPDKPVSLNTSADAQESDPDDPVDVPPSNRAKDPSKAPVAPVTTAPAKRPGDKVIITEVQQSQPTTESPDNGYISTHVLDTSKGRPISGLLVSLYRLVDGRWTHLAESMTNPDGRCTGFVKKQNFIAGRYKLHFDVDRYYEYRRIDSMYPFIEIVFDVRSPQEHYHVPLLLSPYGYTTYKGS